MDSKSVIIIGSGFAGLAAASFMTKAGWKASVIEKQTLPGGRAGQLKEAGFTFDRGPSFYWMPDVFERFFSQFGKKVSDYYQLERLDPSYRIYWNDGVNDIPASYEQLKNLFESIETGSAAKLDKYLKAAAYKYEVGMQKMVYKPGLSFFEFLDWQTISGVFKLQVFSSIRKEIAKHFQHPKLRQLLEFPVLFLGAMPQDTPALYSLMNYADIKGGTWYPKGGMYSVVQAMYQLACELGVQFHFSETVISTNVLDHKVKTVVTDKNIYEPELVISSADYHFTDTKLYPERFRSYSDAYWDKKTMAPSCLLYYVGLNKKLKNAVHHSLFFDTSFEKHGNEIYKNPQWPEAPLFYVSIPSITDETAAPAGCEAMVFLIPVAAGLVGDTEALREKYFQLILSRMEKHLGETIHDAVIFKKSYSVSDFSRDFNSFKGNAYGMANTLMQTAIFRPSCRSKKIKNLFFAGQLTVPGPGVPPCLISGEVAAREAVKSFK